MLNANFYVLKLYDFAHSESYTVLTVDNIIVLELCEFTHIESYVIQEALRHVVLELFDLQTKKFVELKN